MIMRNDDFWPALMKFSRDLSVFFKPGECLWIGDCNKIPIKPIWGGREQKEAIYAVRDAVDEKNFGVPVIGIER